jgi:aspartate/methionine/tyrosine aminotransferase
MNRFTNTEYERLALDGGVNLSDGHARLPLDDIQRSIIATIPQIFDSLADENYEQLERDFIQAFFTLSGQKEAANSEGVFLSFSASSALKMVSQVCRRRRLSILLIEPVFDNIRHFLEFEDVPLVAVGERQLLSPDLLPRHSETAALWIVLPNNPTGFCLSEAQFRDLVMECQTRGYPLIVDASFRLHAETLVSWDMYRILRSSGLDYIVVEDTGKTWSLHDIKVGITLSSSRFAHELHVLHDQLLLNVSPLHLRILTQFIHDTQRRGLEATIRGPVKRNRRVVHELADSSILKHCGNCRNVPLELLGVPANVDAHSFWAACRREGVEVLPAQNYYWTSQTGRHLFRIPLARPTSELIRACAVIRRVVNDLKG